MKRVKSFVLLCLIAIIATGCVKYNATMDIKKDKSMDFTIIYAIDKTMMGESGSLKEESFEDLKKEGYTLEKYSEGNYEGFKIIKKFNNIDEISTDKDVEFDLSGMMEETENNKYMFKVVKNGDKSTYYAKFKFDSNSSNGLDDEDEEETTDDESVLPDENDDLVTTTGEDDGTTIGSTDSSSSLDGMDLSGLMSSMDLSFTVNLPSSAISSNATTKENDNKKLTWKLNYSGAQTIEFAFEIDPNAGGDNLFLYIGIGVGALLLIAIIVILLTRKGGKKEVVPTTDTQVEIKNDANDNVVPSPVTTAEANVMEQTSIQEENKTENNI